MSQWTSILKRHWVLPILGSALIAIVGVGASGQTSYVAQSSVHDPDYPPPYDKSKADRALKTFDERHPKCALWTDWRKLCSRTGPKGFTYCRTDVSHPVEPSAPFCAIDPITEIDVTSQSTYYPLSKVEMLSKNRFSELTHITDCPDCGLVRKYQYDRPFNGLSLSAVHHPACKAWKNESKNISNNDAKFPLLCQTYSKTYHGCRNIGMNYRVEYRWGYDVLNFPKWRGLRKHQIVAGIPLPDSAFSPVWGLHCFETENQQ